MGGEGERKRFHVINHGERWKREFIVEDSKLFSPSLRATKEAFKCHWHGMWRRLRNFHFLPPILQMIPSDNEPAFMRSLFALSRFLFASSLKPEHRRKSFLMALNCSSSPDLDSRCKMEKQEETGELDNRRKWHLNGAAFCSALFWCQWRNQRLMWLFPLPLVRRMKITLCGLRHWFFLVCARIVSTELGGMSLELDGMRTESTDHFVTKFFVSCPNILVKPANTSLQANKRDHWMPNEILFPVRFKGFFPLHERIFIIPLFLVQQEINALPLSRGNLCAKMFMNWVMIRKHERQEEQGIRFVIT